MKSGRKRNTFLGIKFCPKSGRPVKALSKWSIIIFGVLSLIWIIIRVFPKPQRATYPCMKVAFPFASTLIIYLAGISASLLFFKKALQNFSVSRYIQAGTLLLLALGFGLTTWLTDVKDGSAQEASTFGFLDPLGPNVPIGEAKGILPGRVVWIHNPDATNEDCVPWNYFDGYFMDINANQEIVDEMLSKAILEITGSESQENAWTDIFKYFNSTHNKGDVGYQTGEKIFIKINAVHAWDTNEDLSILLDKDYGKVDTSPQVILAVLRQMIYKAGVPQDAIYIGDPYTNIFMHLYQKLSLEFPDIHYMSRGNYENREQLQHTNTEVIKFSDKGTVLDVTEDSYYDCLINADYVLNIPAMKGHRGGGVTFFAKNHFGSNTSLNGAAHMHKGLHKGTSAPLRADYKMYRVFVDLMAYEHLGGKTLIYIGDFLWGTSMEHDPPLKFYSEPFNNDWTSSILVSLDPVAISSVGVDILQEEFQVEDLDAYPQRRTYVRFDAVDDYLHQAASSDWWPEGIVYDPEGDGTPISSLGVHEHWNNATDRQYSRNLGTGNGIELVYLNTSDPNSIRNSNSMQSDNIKIYLSEGNDVLTIELDFDTKENTDVNIYNLSGQLMQSLTMEPTMAGYRNTFSLDQLKSGYYVVSLSNNISKMSGSIVVN